MTNKLVSRSFVFLFCAVMLELVATNASAQENLFRNPGFEDVPSFASGQGLYPSDWQGRGVDAEADTYSEDGSYGLPPGGFGNFPPTMEARSGNRFMAAWTFYPDAFGRETIQQHLALPIAAGRWYRASAWLHRSTGGGQNFPGGYRVQVGSVNAGPYVGTLGFTAGAQLGWRQFSIVFRAPADEASYSTVIFDPIAEVSGTAPYPAIDDVNLYEVTGVTGTADLNGFVGSTMGTLMAIEVWQNGILIETLSASYGPNDSFAFSPSTSGQTTLKFRYRTGLWKAVSVTLGATPIENLLVDMVNGDCDHDNVISVFDYILLSDAFDSTPGDANWNEDADLDGDGVVSVFDYILLSDSFDTVGD